MSELDDDVPQLPADTLAILQKFREEQEVRVELEETGEAEIDEDWQLSQFWYSPDTAMTLCKEALFACGEKGRIGCISSPTLMQYFHKIELGSVDLKVFEYDDRFGKKYPDEFVFYDYKHPHAVPEELKGSFDVVVVDPPFLADECLVKTSQTVRLLAKPDAKIILCTGAIMEEMAGRLLSVKITPFKPMHSNNLANDFACFTNYTHKFLS